MYGTRRLRADFLHLAVLNLGGRCSRFGKGAPCPPATLGDPSSVSEGPSLKIPTVRHPRLFFFPLLLPSFKISLGSTPYWVSQSVLFRWIVRVIIRVIYAVRSVFFEAIEMSILGFVFVAILLNLYL